MLSYRVIVLSEAFNDIDVHGQQQSAIEDARPVAHRSDERAEHELPAIQKPAEDRSDAAIQAGGCFA